MIAYIKEKLQSLVDKLDVGCNIKGMKMNICKIEVMDVTKSKEQLRAAANIGIPTVKYSRSVRCPEVW